jgi:chemotaxis response regulator CheB
VVAERRRKEVDSMSEVMAVAPSVRILIVDDSVVVRKVLSLMLVDEPCLEVVGVASNGKIGLRQVESLKPDLVILDYDCRRSVSATPSCR